MRLGVALRRVCASQGPVDNLFQHIADPGNNTFFSH